MEPFYFGTRRMEEENSANLDRSKLLGSPVVPEDFLEKNKGAVIFYATTKARRVYSDVLYSMDDYIMFGKESAGIPEEILVENEPNCVRIPMVGDIRSLNLGNSVAVILYEALRQNGFPGVL